jgi:hypothetical protein
VKQGDKSIMSVALMISSIHSGGFACACLGRAFGENTKGSPPFLEKCGHDRKSSCQFRQDKVIFVIGRSDMYTHHCPASDQYKQISWQSHENKNTEMEVGMDAEKGQDMLLLLSYVNPYHPRKHTQY